MIKVYMESKIHAEVAAVFADEELYMSCLPALKKYAEEANMIVTESVEDQTIENLLE